VKVNITLRYWKSCLLLRATGTGDDRLALLVVPFRVSQLKRGRLLKCRYIGVVTEDRKNSEPEIDNLKEGSPWRSHIVRIGGRDRDVTRVLDGETAMEQMIDDPNAPAGDLPSDTDSDNSDSKKPSKKNAVIALSRKILGRPASEMAQQQRSRGTRTPRRPGTKDENTNDRRASLYCGQKA